MSALTRKATAARAAKASTIAVKVVGGTVRRTPALQRALKTEARTTGKTVEELTSQKHTGKFSFMNTPNTLGSLAMRGGKTKARPEVYDDETLRELAAETDRGFAATKRAHVARIKAEQAAWDAKHAKPKTVKVLEPVIGFHHVGRRVSALWEDGKRYTGTLHRLKVHPMREDQHIIKWDDGTRPSHGRKIKFI